MRIIDDLLNRITMYRLVLYYLLVLVVIAVGLSTFQILAYNPLAIIFSALVAVTVCWATNLLVSSLFRAQPSVESAYITALILALIISPALPTEIDQVSYIIAASFLAMITKYVLILRKRHVFNPAAIGLVLTGVLMDGAVSWWVGSASMIIPVALGGLLIIRKMQRFEMVSVFIVVTLCASVMTLPVLSSDILWAKILYTPLLFFAAVMLVEPMTMPSSRYMRLVYAGIVGVLFTSSVHIGTFFASAQMALVIGNIFSFAVTPNVRLMLKLKRIERTSASTSEFVFEADQKINHKPGQYLEWTLPHDHPDSRGNRRYFTIASSPTEDDVRLGVKFYDPPSSFKRALAGLRESGMISASQLAGDFVLPDDVSAKLVFIAGGIGITPFRSMLRYMIDTKERRDVILMYSNRRAEDIAYQPLFSEAQRALGIKIVNAVTDDPHAVEVQGYASILDAALIKKEVPDYLERIFYISGPRVMVVAFEHTLKELGVSSHHIKTDFFPGFV